MGRRPAHSLAVQMGGKVGQTALPVERNHSDLQGGLPSSLEISRRATLAHRLRPLLTGRVMRLVGKVVADKVVGRGTDVAPGGLY